MLEEELAGLATPDQFRLEGERVMLPPALVQSLSMIVHELGANAAKYGALAASDGRVAIDCSRTPAGLALHWRESGGPPVTEPSGGGFGSRLVRQLARQVEADLEFAWRPDCLQVSLVLPLNGVLSGGRDANPIPPWSSGLLRSSLAVGPRRQPLPLHDGPRGLAGPVADVDESERAQAAGCVRGP